MTFYVDFQCFKHGNYYIIKELAILDGQTPCLLHFVFKPPFNLSRLSDKDRKQADWLKLNYHKIPWQVGYVNYGRVFEILKQGLRNAKKIYVKGEEKKYLLESFGYQHVINIEYLKFKYKIQDHCNHGLGCIWHGQKGGICALRNVFYMRKRMKNYNFF